MNRKWRSRLFGVCLGLALASVLATLIFPGCATLVSGTTQSFSVTTTPEAEVYVNGKRIEGEVVTTRLIRWGFYKMRLELPGHEPIEFRLKKSVNSMVLGNIIIGVVPGVVDIISGAMWNLEMPSKEIERLNARGYEVSSRYFLGGEARISISARSSS